MDSSSILSCNETRPFWLSWDKGNIGFGTGYIIGEDSVINWKDTVKPLDVQAITVSTDDGSTGQWILPVLPGKYRFL